MSGPVASPLGTESALQDGIQLCDNCNKIDFDSLMQHPCYGQVVDISRSKSDFFELRYSPGCSVCELLFREPRDDVCMLRSFSFFSTYPWMQQPHREYKGTDSVLLGLGSYPILDGKARSYSVCDVACRYQSDDSTDVYKLQPIAAMWNADLALTWLQDCQNHHGALCDGQRTKIEGLHLIDCEEMTVVAGDDISIWLALSYVWGQSDAKLAVDTRNYTHGCPLPSNLPLTVQDAVSVTIKLGYRYLWVDEYCIDQSNESHIHDQIGKMDQIYHGAQLTLVAAAGSDKHYGLPGVSNNRTRMSSIIRVKDVTLFRIGKEPDRHIKYGTEWFKRAWTFQEGLLSRRLLVFTDEQMSFFCKTRSWMEALSGPQYANETSKSRSEPTIGQSLFPQFRENGGFTRWEVFTRCAEMYSTRSITYDLDALSAFMGVTNYLLNSSIKTTVGIRNAETSDRQEAAMNVDGSDPVVYSMSGLPFCMRPDVRTMLFRALSWKEGYDIRLRRRKAFPSWTWIGWEGEICFNILHTLNPFDTSFKIPSTFIQRVYLETSDDRLVDPNSISLWTCGRQIQALLESVVALRFEAPNVDSRFLLDDLGGDDVGNSQCTNSRLFWSWDRDVGFNEISRNLRSGVWSAFLLGAIERTVSHTVHAVVMIVQWHDTKTAERVHILTLWCRNGIGQDFKPGEHKMRQLRLI